MLFLAAQQTAELFLANRNEAKLKRLGAVEIDRGGYRFIVLMHLLFFVSLIVERVFIREAPNREWPVFLGLFSLAQVLRYWSIASLGIYWNTKVIVLPNHPRIQNGPYKLFRHPNYIAVIVELAVIPIIFSCYITATVFSIVNAFVVARRMEIEMRALRGYSGQ